jgi:hypothetical protein
MLADQGKSRQQGNQFAERLAEDQHIIMAP